MELEYSFKVDQNYPWGPKKSLSEIDHEIEYRKQQGMREIADKFLESKPYEKIAHIHRVHVVMFTKDEFTRYVNLLKANTGFTLPHVINDLTSQLINGGLK